MHAEIVERIDDIPAADWNRVSGTAQPFLRHEFLAALEHHDCVGERFGWYPQHVVVRNIDGALAGAAPLYLKDNSYGEFVFDFSWANAYHQAGLNYYPKLTSAIPFSPVTGPRLLVNNAREDARDVQMTLVQAAMSLTKSAELSASETDICVNGPMLSLSRGPVSSTERPCRRRAGAPA